MKKLLFATFLLIQAATFAQTTWKNDKMHSKLTFTVTHLMVSDVDGLFKNLMLRLLHPNRILVMPPLNLPQTLLQ